MGLYRYLQNKFRTILVKMVYFHPSQQVCATHGCQNNAVLNLAVSDLPRRKQRFQLLFHRNSSFAFSLAYPITQSYNNTF